MENTNEELTAQELFDKKMARAGDIIRAYKNGDMEREDCIMLLMSKCNRSYETACINIQMSELYGSTSNIPYTGYGKACEHHPDKQRKSIAPDVFMDKSRSYELPAECTGLYRSY